ncbi:dTDP-4-dehydrorhamnose 3,5-epimerase [Thiorhodovibrio winogradskyi]|uniref:dTDP-4-dehydrorhamnose 3,5-epimerase n=1 Tax=Thiorhodovibrio winogradskyi TaxID=77007 RepID=A0ABZ0S246_9GAMM|nr:dTDP-4-dehydrorhamnose 3,5-epimerase [Thiorhodovibrio winogradskyi]
MPPVVESLAIPAVKLIHPQKHGDARGFFSETYSQGDLATAGIDIHFVQDNHAFSVERGTLRGLHFQTPPFAQHKLIRVIRGAILDVAVDLRTCSPTYGQHVSAMISAEAWNQLLVPIGFAHGLMTLEPNTEVLYKVSSSYSPEHDKGLLWNDPALAIDWPLVPDAAILSDKDRRQPTLAELPAYFE